MYASPTLSLDTVCLDVAAAVRIIDAVEASGRMKAPPNIDRDQLAADLSHAWMYYLDDKRVDTEKRRKAIGRRIKKIAETVHALRRMLDEDHMRSKGDDDGTAAVGAVDLFLSPQMLDVIRHRCESACKIDPISRGIGVQF